MTPHVCPTCAPGPNRVFDHDRRVANVPRAFRGPATSMHGGAAAGAVACLADRHLSGPMARFNVRLHAPPPLGTDLPYRVQLDADGRRLGFEVGEPDAIVLSGWAATATADAAREPVVPEDVVAELAARASLDAARRHRFDTYVDTSTEEFSECFGCGPHNDDGLHLRTRVIDDGHAWIDWTPPLRWHDGGQLALLPAIAALDCTSAIPLRDFGVTSEAETVLLGTYDGRVHRRPPATVGESFRIVTSTRRREGRKIYADIGLFAPDGEVFITGCATWIVLAA
ncbi:MAG: hypothetical protein AB7W59_21300 [Acidimicrobiia bacterium]